MIAATAAAAAGAAPELDRELIDLVADVLTGRYTGDAEAHVVSRFQQLTGPVAAKGEEDTALYRWLPLPHRCEVGVDPSRATTTADAWNAACAVAQQRWPERLTTLSTHDTKRSADARARLAALTTVPVDALAAFDRWWDALAATRGTVDAGTGWLLFHVLVAGAPIELDRAWTVVEKSVREAGVRTSWTAPDAAFEADLRILVAAALDDVVARTTVLQLLEATSRAADVGALGQLLAQLLAPGVADLYQGAEAWDRSLVDPDNRRPPDPAVRRALLADAASITPPSAWADIEQRRRGLPRTVVLRTALSVRRRHPEALGPGPLGAHTGLPARARTPIGCSPSRAACRRAWWRSPSGRRRPMPSTRSWRSPTGSGPTCSPVRRTAARSMWASSSTPFPSPSWSGDAAGRVGAGRRQGRGWCWATAAASRSSGTRTVGTEVAQRSSRGTATASPSTGPTRSRTRARAGSPTVSMGSLPSTTRRSTSGPTRAGSGLDLLGGVIYELHVGTFTEDGTFDGAIERLDQLADLGVTAVELMPVAEAMGDRGWGYDGVDLWATHHAYGGPAGLRRFVDAAHRRGLGVLLDVVYNHLGPEGSYLARFGPYFTDRHSTPWGPAVNLDGPGVHGGPPVHRRQRAPLVCRQPPRRPAHRRHPPADRRPSRARRGRAHRSAPRARRAHGPAPLGRGGARAGRVPPAPRPPPRAAGGPTPAGPTTSTTPSTPTSPGRPTATTRRTGGWPTSPRCCWRAICRRGSRVRRASRRPAW